MKIAYAVQIYFDMDFPYLPKEQRFVEDRKELFEKYTYPSLMNQTEKDFEILLLCGRTHKKFTFNSDWPDGVRICYDKGRGFYERTDADYVAIIRIDSDDLYHRKAVELIKENIVVNNKRTCLFFRKGWTWEQANGCLVPRFRMSPPFYTHVFPKAIYKNWTQFNSEHFVGHGQAGGRHPDTVILPEYKYCVIRHGSNMSYWKRGVSYEIWDKKKLSNFIKTHPEGKYSPESTAEELKDFGIDKNEVYEKIKREIRHYAN